MSPSTDQHSRRARGDKVQVRESDQELGAFQGLHLAWRLLSFSFPLWHVLLALLALTLANSLVGVVNPWGLKILVDNVVGDNPLAPSIDMVTGGLLGQDKVRLLAFVVFLVLATRIGQGLIRLAIQYTQMVFSESMSLRLRDRVYGHLHLLSLRLHEDRKIGDSLQRVLRDTGSVPNLAVGVVLPLLGSGFMIITMVMVLWRLAPDLALLSLIAVPAMMAASALFTKRLFRQSSTTYERDSDLFSEVQESLTNIRLVKAFAREDFAQERFSRLSEESLAARLRLRLSHSFLGLTNVVIGALGMGFMLWVAGSRAIEGAISAGDVIVFLSYLTNMYGTAQGMLSMAGSYQNTLAAGHRVVQVLDLVPTVTDPRSPRPIGKPQGTVVFDNVTFGYRPDTPVLEGLGFTVTPGTSVAFVGRSGAGKTTIFNLILRFYDPDQGRVLLDGVDIREYAQRDLRSVISLVAQDALLFDATIAQNIRYGRLDASRDEVRRAMQLAGVDEFVRKLPDGAKTKVSEGGKLLSGGQKQRIAIARAILRDAPIVLLDEPTSGLDGPAEAHFLRAVRALKKDRSTLIIAHRLSTAMDCDIAIVLSEGRVVEMGPPGELARREGAFYELFESQIAAV